MNLPPVVHGLRRARSLVASVLLAATAAGCASSGAALPMRPGASSLAPGSPLASRTLPDGDAWLRHYLMRGDFDDALHVLRRSSARPGDRLLRTLQEALVLHHGGRHAESNRLFEWAEQEADRRYTHSVRQNLGSLVVSDLVLAYTPSAGEMAAIPYYRMLNYLALGDVPSAAVEARKASAYIARLDDRKREGCRGFGLVQYMAGHVFAAAGERNDALVSMRQAERSFAACGGTSAAMPNNFAADLYHAALAVGVQDVADSVASQYGLTDAPLQPGEADLIVLIEHGFAAHRVQQDLLVPVWREQVGAGEDAAAPSAAAVAGQITRGLAASVLAGPEAHRLWDQSVWNLTSDRAYWSANDLATRPEVAHVLRLAWPVMRLEASRAATARLVVDGHAVDAPALEDVSARLVHDLESRRNAILARMVTRSMIKFLATREAEEQAEKKGGELLGAVVGFVTNSAANALEQADTRTWSLLPDQISVARVRLPAGERDVRIEVFDSRNMITRTVDLGSINAQPGERIFVSQRIWGADAGDRDRLIRLGMDAYGRSDVPTVVVDGPPPARRTARDRPVRRPTGAPALPPHAPPAAVPVGAAPPPPVARPPGTLQ